MTKMTETQVLSRLGIQDFRHMTKDKVLAFASMLHELDPETAKEAINQFPNFSTMIAELVVDYREMVSCLSDNNKSVSEECLTILNGIANTLSIHSGNADSTYEDRRFCIEQLVVVAGMAAEIDRSTKEYNAQTHLLATIVVLVLGAFATALLGVNVRFRAL